MAKTKTKKADPRRQIADVGTEERGGYSTRVCVPAPMPVQCPHCRSSRTTAANGVHYNAHFAVRYEHRVCSACGYTFTATRRMTAEELERRGG